MIRVDISYLHVGQSLLVIVVSSILGFVLWLRAVNFNIISQKAKQLLTFSLAFC